MKLKASKPSLNTNYNALYDFQHFVAFPVDPVHLKKPSRWPKALIGPPLSMPWGPWPPEAKDKEV
jgi:hypothetical protein